jgi:hypothetical protein
MVIIMSLNLVSTHPEKMKNWARISAIVENSHDVPPSGPPISSSDTPKVESTGGAAGTQVITIRDIHLDIVEAITPSST